MGTKIDTPNATLNANDIATLVRSCECEGFFETSALTGRGILTLCQRVSESIDWQALGETTRPALFQQVRNEIERRRQRGDVILSIKHLRATLIDSSLEDEEKAIDAVTQQLAKQGVIARSRVSSGDSVLVLQIREIERYAGSLIIAARNNPRKVPALALNEIRSPSFVLPGIDASERLTPEQETPVLECTVQLLLEHGICFEHKGLLVFPTLFASSSSTTPTTLEHSISLHYDFSGAIDNIYASLVAWLVLARDFGQVRLWADRAEFEVENRGLCGIRKVTRPSGFAHVDVYFEKQTPAKRRDEFISFVEDHLRNNGIDITEHIAVDCPRGNIFDEETLRLRIADGHRDVLCPRCETRHSMSEGAATVRKRDPGIERNTWALKTEIEKRRERKTREAVKRMERPSAMRRANDVIRVLHLSDLHFSGSTSVQARLQPLLADIRDGEAMDANHIDYIVISGDFTDKGGAAGFTNALKFVTELSAELDVAAERCVFVPGNHDVRDIAEAFETRESANGEAVVIQSEKYAERFRPFSDEFYHKFLQRPYPLTCDEQAFVIPFEEDGIEFIALNSCWQIDQHNRKRASVHPDSIARVLKESNVCARRYAKGVQPLRIAVWHHAVTGSEAMLDTSFVDQLQIAGVAVALHGDVHEVRRDQNKPWKRGKELYIAGAGAFGAAHQARPESTPRLYNILELQPDRQRVRIQTRSQDKAESPWKPWNGWPRSRGAGAIPYYDIKLARE